MRRPPIPLLAALCTALVAFRAPGAVERPAPAGVDAPFAAALPRAVPGALRVVTWNIGANSIVPSRDDGETSRPAAFARVVRALDPDVVCLQELTIGPERAAALFDRIRPLGNGARWHAVSELGNVLLSRHPLTGRQGRTFRHRLSQRGHVIAQVAVPGSAATDAPTVACMHLQAKGGEANRAFRERHAAAVAADLAGATGPVIALGDMNAVDADPTYIRTLQRGASTAGAAFPLAAARASHNGAGTDAWTWRNDRSGFAPGVLDWVLFSDRRLAARGAFVLNTLAMPDAALASAGLRRADALRDAAAGEYDHLPVVVDLEAIAAR